MSRALITTSYLTGIANAIRAKNGSSDTYTPPQMAAAIEAIPTGGITPTGTKQITQNGVHDVTQYASANVSVQPNLQSKTVTENGTVTPDAGYDGLSSVVVNVSGGGGGSDILVPEYQGLAYSYIAINGQYFQSNEGKIYYSSYFHVAPNHTYALFVGDTISDRLRAHFYAGKNYSDFEYYVNNGLTNQAVFTSTYNISGTSDLSGEELKQRLLYTPTVEGEIVFVTSRSSVAAVAYCVKLT